MAKFRPVYCSFWRDPIVLEELTPTDKLFFLHLLTNDQTTQIGVYCITKKQIAFELGYSIDVVENLMDRFINQYKLIKYNTKTRELGIKHWGRYNFIKGGKPIEDCVRKELDEIKDKELLSYVLPYIKLESIKSMVEEHLAAVNTIENEEVKKNDGEDVVNDEKSTKNVFCEDFEQVSFADIDLNIENSTGVIDDVILPSDTIRGQKEKENNKNTNSNNKNNKLLYSKIIDYLNVQSFQDYETNDPEAIKVIKSKIAEGFNYDDFKRVIDIKCKEWLGTKFDVYLRPSTLFGNKFERYLNQKSPAYINNSFYNNDSFSNRKQRSYDMKKIENIILGYY